MPACDARVRCARTPLVCRGPGLSATVMLYGLKAAPALLRDHPLCPRPATF